MNGLTTKRMRQIWGGIALGVLITEVVGLVRPQRGDTLSEVQDDIADSLPLVPLATGLVAGHWYWKPKHMAPFLIGAGIGILVWPLGREAMVKE